MRSPSASIATALETQSSGVVVIYYPDAGLREWLLGEVESLAPPGAPCLRLEDPELAVEHPDELVLLTTPDEAGAVRTLEGIRERFLETPRSYPVVLFLLRDGAGGDALRDSPGLASWVHGSDPDPERISEADPEVERASFRERTGEAPDVWLAQWREGLVADTPANLSLAYWAMLLEVP